MQVSTASLLPAVIVDLYAQIKASGRITLTDRFVIKTALLEGCLSEDELVLLDRIFYSVRRGRIKMVNELRLVTIGEPSLEPALPKRAAIYRPRLINAGVKSC